MKKGKIEFIQYHQPALKAGDYQITVTQQIHSSSKISPITQNSFQSKKSFSVLGERFSLPPQDIHALFPPMGSLGEHSNVLPHIILKRSTMPWERMVKPCEGCLEDPLPWLALLLFNEDEAPAPQIAKVSDLKYGSTAKFPQVVASQTPLPAEPYLELEMAQHEDDKLTVIDVPKYLLTKLLPTKEDLSWLAHVRSGSLFSIRVTEYLQNQLDQGILPDELRDQLNKKGYALSSKPEIIVITVTSEWKIEEKSGFFFKKEQDENQCEVLNVYAIEDEKAVVIANRLPKKGKTSTMHLVSLENRYNDSGFDFQGAKDEELIRLVSLKNWYFACMDEQQDFKTLLYNLNRSPSTVMLAEQDDPVVNNYLLAGYVPLRHYLREGSNTVSWYHGPLRSGKNQTQISFPIRAADQLLHYDQNLGLFDVSYAAAWELGRLLTLQSKRVSLALFNWKRTHKQQLKQAERTLSHLSAWEPKFPPPPFPEVMTAWFNELSLLKTVPFNYLIPDEKLLPNESIRFFCLDSLWVECLVDGAYSIGRVNKSDYETQHDNKPSFNTLPAQITGFLLRSDVVSGWPDLLIDGYKKAFSNKEEPDDEDKLIILRMERLSAKVLICLFAGEVKTIDIHQKPEALHFGVNRPDKRHIDYYKILKNPKNGEEFDENLAPNKIIDLNNFWHDDSEKIIAINRLATLMKSTLSSNFFTSAQFSLQMIEGVQNVRFVISIS